MATPKVNVVDLVLKGDRLTKAEKQFNELSELFPRTMKTLKAAIDVNGQDYRELFYSQFDIYNRIGMPEFATIELFRFRKKPVTEESLQTEKTKLPHSSPKCSLKYLLSTQH